MKLQYKISIFLIGLLIVTSTVFGQQKTVEYLLHTHFEFAVPEGTDIDKIAGIDFATIMIPKSKEHFEMILNYDNTITTVISNMQTPKNDFDIHNSIAQTVIDYDGITMYDQNMKQVYHEAHASKAPMQYNLTDEMVKQWGTSTGLFRSNINEMAKQFTLANYKTTLSEERLTVFMDTMEMIFDFGKLCLETRTFDQANVLQRSRVEFHERISEDMIIPLKDEVITYNEFPESGIRFQKTEIRNYLSYTITELGRVIVDVQRGDEQGSGGGTSISNFKEVEKTGFGFKVFPNPASEQLNLEFQVSADEPVNIEIFNTTGVSVLQHTGTTGKAATLNISALSAGIYIIHCQQNGMTKAVKFIKQ